MEGLSAENLIAKVKIIFAEYGIPHRLMSNAGSNFVSEKFRSSTTVSAQADSVIIIPSPKQWTSRSLHKIH